MAEMAKRIPARQYVRARINLHLSFTHLSREKTITVALLTLIVKE